MQGLQLIFIVSSWYSPGLHAVQLELLPVGANEPAGHGVGAALPAGHCVPAGHVWHCATSDRPFVAPKVPAGQLVSVALPFGQYVPLEHSMGSTVAMGQ